MEILENAFVCFEFFLHKQTSEESLKGEQAKNFILRVQTQIFFHNSSYKYVKRNPKIDINFGARWSIVLFPISRVSPNM